MQKFIFLMLIVGLGFFLYLLKTGEISSDAFNIKRLQPPIQFEISKNSAVDQLDNKLSQIRLSIRGQLHPIYSFTGTSFSHISKNEYYKDIYKIPGEALDAVTGTWLGSRYVFYVTEVKENENTSYHVFQTQYTTDSTEPVVYKRVKIIQGYTSINKTETY